MATIRLNIHDAKTHLSRHLNEMTEEDEIILCRRNQPVAEIRLIPRSRTAPRRLGLAQGDFVVPDSFFEPLPDDLLDAFEGKASR